MHEICENVAHIRTYQAALMLIDRLWGLTCQRNAGDEAGLIGGLRINFDHLGIFNER